MNVYILYPTKRFVANAPPVNFLVNFGIDFFSDPPNWASAVSEKRFGRRRCRKNILGVGGVGKTFSGKVYRQCVRNLEQNINAHMLVFGAFVYFAFFHPAEVLEG